MDDIDNAAASGPTADNEARPEPATVAPPASDTRGEKVLAMWT